MDFAKTERTTLKRLPKRGVFDRELVYAILDEGFICHVGFVVDAKPVVIPTGYARVADQLYIHGSQASRMLRTLKTGIDVCVTVTLIDGLVLARSAFHHSMNYRSVVAFGTARKIEERDEKNHALRMISEHLIRGRWEDVRQPTDQELKATSVLEFAIEEASAKIRTGPPADDEEDYALSMWAGVLPLNLVAESPIPDSRLTADTPVPDYVLRYRKT